MEALPSFYYSESGNLTWNQSLYNIATECLYLPYFHHYSHFIQVDAITLECRRVQKIPYGSWKDYAFPLFKVMLAATIIAPLVCYGLAYTKATESSWQQLKKEYSCSGSSLRVFLFSQILVGGSTQNALALLANSHLPRGSTIEERVLLLDRLDPDWPNIMKEHYRLNKPRDMNEQGRIEESIIEFIGIRLEQALHSNQEVADFSTWIEPLYASLNGKSQVETLRRLSEIAENLDESQDEAIRAIAIALLLHSEPAAREHPVNFLQELLPLALRGSENPLNFYFCSLYKHNPEIDDQFRSSMERLIEHLSKCSLVGLFWRNITEGWSDYDSEKDRLSFHKNRKNYIRSFDSFKKIDFSEMRRLEELTGQPWMDLWYSAYDGKLDEGCVQLRGAFEELPTESELPLTIEDIPFGYDRRTFLEQLTLSDLTRLLSSDPTWEWLEAAFGTEELCWQCPLPSATPSREGEEGERIINVPYALFEWLNKICRDTHEHKKDELIELFQGQLKNPRYTFYCQWVEVALWSHYLPQIRRSIAEFGLSADQDHPLKHLQLLDSKLDPSRRKESLARVIKILTSLGASSTAPPSHLKAEIDRLNSNQN